ncbi:MAG: HAD-IIA family hydrolase [Roseobacter sp.]
MVTGDAAWAVQQYESVRELLPKATMPGHFTLEANLGEIADDFDVFLLDAFGVLNVGNSATAGATERVNMLQDMGKRVLVLTNAATYPAEVALQKFTDFGFGFQLGDIVSSRDAPKVAMAKREEADLWAAMSAPASAVERLGVPWQRLGYQLDVYDLACGFLLLSTSDWHHAQYALLRDSLAKEPSPVLVGNPDIVAPREDRFSLEPGFFVYQIARRLGLALELFGKPFGNIYDLALERLPDTDLVRVTMVGDTLHTDVLGGAAYGIKTVLVTDHGLFAGCDCGAFVAQTGIMPNDTIPGI